MSLLEFISKLLALMKLLAQVGETAKAVRRLRLPAGLGPTPVSYENLYLNVVFDIRDRRGERAVVTRKQRVRFRVDDSGIIRDVVWGEGDPLWRYSVTGARCVGVRQEGSRRAVLLALVRKPSRGDKAVVSTFRAVRNAVPGATGYAESYVERPTRRLALKVLFPRSRPPQEAHLVASPSTDTSRPIPVRYASDGRPYLSWSRRRPEKYVTYSLRWAW